MISKINKLKKECTSNREMLEALKKLEKCELINKYINACYEQEFRETGDIKYLINMLNHSDNKTKALLCNNIAIQLLNEFKIEQAVVWYKKSLEFDPTFKMGYYGLINISSDYKNDSMHIEWIETALKQFPDDPEFINFKALWLWSHCQSVEALELLEKSLTNGNRIPPLIRCRNAMNLGFFYSSFGYNEKSNFWFEQSKKADKTHLITYENILLNSLYSIKLYPVEVTELHNRYSEKFISKKLLYLPNSYIRDKKRVAIFSGDFGEHAVSCFTKFFKLSKKIDYYYFSNSPEDPELLKKNLETENVFIIFKLPVQTIHEILKKNNIDTMIDLSGYTAKNRLDVFSSIKCKRKYTFCGYPADLGIPAFDDVIRISDDWTEKNNYIKTLKLPRLFCCYHIPDDLVVEHKKIEDKEDFFVIGCFSKLQKINESVLSAWIQILDELKKNEIKTLFIIKTNYITEEWCPQFTKRDDVLLLKSTHTHKDHLNLYNYLDLTLDTWPYNGTTITCESLVHNVPVITLCDPHGNHVSRVGGTILNSCGLNDLITYSYEEYITKAIDFVTNKTKIEVREPFEKVMNEELFSDEFDSLILSDSNNLSS